MSMNKQCTCADEPEMNMCEYCHDTHVIARSQGTILQSFFDDIERMMTPIPF